MPYNRPSDAPDSVPKEKKAQWVEVWNSVYAAAVKDKKSQAEAEGEAFKQANGVVKERQGMGFEVGVQTSADPNIKIQPDLDAQPGATPVMRKQAQHPADGKFTTATTHTAHKSDVALQAANQNATKFEVGDYVKHAAGDSGSVTSIDGDILHVTTDEGKNVLWQASRTELQPRKDDTRETVMTQEVRYATEMRAMSEGDEMSLVGYAAKFNSPSKQMTDKSGISFVETIAPGAFTRALAANADVRCLFNHDSNRVLGRTKSGTLTLKQDDKGLAFRCMLDSRQQAHRDLHAAVDRGDISECSFAFAPNGPDGDDWQDTRTADGWQIVRTLKDVNLFDVSAVTHPAYNDTSVSAREATMTPEIRSIVNKLVEKRAKAVAEKRDDNDCLEEYISEVCKALAEKFPCTDEQKNYCCGSGMYWVCETYVDYVIASECGTGEYVRITYMEDGDDNFVFGTPTPVEKEWVPSERAVKHAEETRAMKASHMQSIADEHSATAAAHKDMVDAHTAAADAHADHADAHTKAAEAAQKEADRMQKCEASMGDCSVRGCTCQNNMASDDEVWDEEDHEGEDENERKLRHQTKCAEIRGADGKTRTKKVDGKNLPASAFASVGDPNDTSTWKLPIHDKAHADNAAARLNQTDGIDKEAAKAKIEAAQKKFGEKKDDKRSLNPDEQPMTPEEVEDWTNKLKLATL